MATSTKADFIVPLSTHAVEVSIIDTSAAITLPLERFLSPIIPGLETLTAPCFSFLITHPSSSRKLLFDLGVRPDWTKLVPHTADFISGPGWDLQIEKDVATILAENGSSPADVEGIIWSHPHFDHVGDPSTFPASTDLIVGPGFKEGILPGYPKRKDSSILEPDYEGRNIKEIRFDQGLKIGRFDAFDFFGDGSFYLLDAPGHCVAHIMGLARTTPSTERNEATFILMGGDCAHHAGEFRPSPYQPLPLAFPAHHTLHRSLYPSASASTSDPPRIPFYSPADPGVSHDVPQARESVEKLQEADAQDQILVMIAHDPTLLDIVDFFPKRANDWQERGWKEKGRWAFLKTFDDAARKATAGA